jgi:hypothetical protein
VVEKTEIQNKVKDIPEADEKYIAARSDIALDMKREQLKGNIQDRKARKKFAKKIFKLLCWFLAAVMLLVYLCAWGFFRLSDTVMVALLTTTTIDVIGIFIFVARYLFRPSCSECGKEY